MKQFFYVAILVTMISGTLSGQTNKPYPIPSYQVTVNGTAFFCESNDQGGDSDLAKGKRNGIVKVYSPGSEDPGCSATIWWYSLDGLDILGPFTVLCGETLTVEIDERAWGVLVQTESDVLVDVWID